MPSSGNQNKKSATRELQSYKFKTSSYVIVKGSIRRDSSTGRLVSDTKKSRATSDEK
jgi:hypothetical protein